MSVLGMVMDDAYTHTYVMTATNNANREGAGRPVLTRGDRAVVVVPCEIGAEL